MKRKYKDVKIIYESKRKSDLVDFIENIIDAMLRMFSWIILISIIIIGAYETPNIFEWNDITENYTCVMNNFYIKEDYGSADVEILNEFVETLPPIFISEFRKCWRVIIEDYIPPHIDCPNNVIIGGYTDWKSRVILIKKQTNPNDTLNIFVHELGHCFDFEYGSVSYSDLFGDIYDIYKDNFSEQYTDRKSVV